MTSACEYRRTSHRYRGGHGFASRWSPDYFQASFFQLLKLENFTAMIIRHFHLQQQFKYDLCHIYLKSEVNFRPKKSLARKYLIVARAIIGEGDRKSWDPRAAAIWDNFSILRTNCAILTSYIRADPRGFSRGYCHVAWSLLDQMVRVTTFSSGFFTAKNVYTCVACLFS